MFRQPRFPFEPLREEKASCQGCRMPSRGRDRRRQEVIGQRLPFLEDLFSNRCLRRACNIVRDSTRPGHGLVELLPSSRPFRLRRAPTNRLRDSFYEVLCCVDFDNACWDPAESQPEPVWKSNMRSDDKNSSFLQNVHIISILSVEHWWVWPHLMIARLQISPDFHLAEQSGGGRQTQVEGTWSPCLRSAATFTSTTWRTDCWSLASVPSWYVIYLISWLEVRTQPTLSKKLFSPPSVNSQMPEAFLTPNQSRRQTAINHSSEQDWVVTLTSLI